MSWIFVRSMDSLGGVTLVYVTHRAELRRTGDAEAMSSGRRYAIVTPYYKEDRSLLERCVQSVRQQTVLTDHFVVADGVPQSWRDGESIRHIKLDRAHGDYGNTPRGVGSLLAITEGYDGIGFLDADNWLEPQHVELCSRSGLSAEGAAPYDFVIAQRNFTRPDESIIPVPDESPSVHVDTNCWFMLRSSFHVVLYFGTMPRELAPVCDRIFYGAVKARGLKGTMVSDQDRELSLLVGIDLCRGRRSAAARRQAQYRRAQGLRMAGTFVTARDRHRVESLRRELEPTAIAQARRTGYRRREGRAQQRLPLRVGAQVQALSR